VSLVDCLCHRRVGHKNWPHVRSYYRHHIWHRLSLELRLIAANVVEFTVATIALIQGQVAIVQLSLLGSMLSRILFGLGLCFFFAGVKFKESNFNTTVPSPSNAANLKEAKIFASILALSVSCLIIPTAFSIALNSSASSTIGVLSISRATAILLLFVYAMFVRARAS
jgi:Ca2+:H+ antiporter